MFLLTNLKQYHVSNLSPDDRRCEKYKVKRQYENRQKAKVTRALKKIQT